MKQFRIFTIKGEDIQSVEIANNIGQVIFKHQYPENNVQNIIDISKQANGIYFVKTLTGKKLNIEKLIINNAN